MTELREGASALLDALVATAGKRKRVALDDVWRAFASADPVTAAAVDKRARLRAALDALAARDALRLPRGRAAYDATGTPPLPTWIELVRSAPRPPTPAPEAWAPELEFARELRHPRQLEALAKVQAWLAAGGRDRPLVPARERAIEVFGAEKSIDGLARSRLFGPGRLSYALLRCFPVAPPLVLEVQPDAPPRGLVIENHHTFHSFARWNADAAAYRFVGYGGGKVVIHAAPSLAETCRDHAVSTLEYFGDLDAAGLAIAQELAVALESAGGPRVRPAVTLYEALLARREGVPPIPDDTGDVRGRDLDWLIAALDAAGLAESARAAREIVERGRRLPQELVGWEWLVGARHL